MTMTLRITNLGPAQYAASIRRGDEPLLTTALGLGQSCEITCWKDGGPLVIEEVPGTPPVPVEVPFEERILAHFTYGHLPMPLAAVSRPFCELAHSLVKDLPPGPERSVALRKLLEGKDAAVRAALK